MRRGIVGAGVLAAVFSAACGGESSGGAAGAGAIAGAKVGGVGGSGGVPVTTTTDKVDLLLVIDNSISMADKQQILAATVPRLVQRLAILRAMAPRLRPE